MKALVFDQPGPYEQVLALQEMAAPLPGPDEVIVAVKARPVDPADLYFIEGRYRKKPLYPQVAGLAGSGIVKQCGRNVKRFSIGDHVAFRGVGTWAEQVSVNADALISIDPDIPFASSCQLALNGLTAKALLVESYLTAGDLLLLNAAGSSLGQLLIQLAAGKGIRVIALIRDAQKTQDLRDLGAEFVIVEGRSMTEELQAILNGERIHCFLDAVGGAIISSVLPLMATGGRLIHYGNLSNSEPFTINSAQLIYQNLTLSGFGIDHWSAGWTPVDLEQYYAELMEDLAAGKLNFPAAQEISLEDLLTAPKTSGTKMILVS